MQSLTIGLPLQVTLPITYDSSYLQFMLQVTQSQGLCVKHNQSPPSSSMDLQPWVFDVFKCLDMTGFQGYSHDLPKIVDKWLPKFYGCLH
jgi:hypothetical protein